MTIKSHAAPLLTLAALVLLAPAVSAQIAFDPRIDTRRDNCGAIGASRARSRCEPARAARTPPPAAATTEQELTVRLELPPVPRAQCDATATTQYQQRNTIARVDTTLAVAGCPAASGELTVVARIRDETGEVKSLAFAETWQRAEAGEVKLTADYPIGENVDLVNVGLRGLTCTCAEEPAAKAATTAAQPASPAE